MRSLMSLYLVYLRWKSSRLQGITLGGATTLVSGRACFTIVVTKSCLQRNGQLWVPKVHREDWLDDFDGNEVRIIYGVQEGSIGLVRSTSGMRFGHGWSEFARRCSFPTQSECIFELIDSLIMVYHVHLY